MLTNLPYTSADYLSERFKPTNLVIKKEVISKTQSVHYHDEIEYLYILEGSGIIEINQTELAIQQGDLIQLMPYHVNRLMVKDDQLIKLFRIQFSIGLLLFVNTDKTRYLDAVRNIDKSLPILSLKEKDGEQITFLCDIVLKEKGREVGDTELLHISLVSFLAYFTHKYQQPKRGKAIERKLAWKALEYIQIHHQEQLTLHTISQALNTSEKDLTKVLKETTGFNFTALLNQVRIRNAAALLQFDGLSINQIGKISGYRTEAAFYKIFKQVQGITPLIYRNQLPGRTVVKSKDDAWEAAVYILENCNKELTLDETAKSVNLSSKKVNDLLKETFGKTFKKLLNQFRVHVGKNVLVSMQLTVQEAAELSGFSDTASFTRNFKSVYGMTPKKLMEIRSKLNEK